MATVTQRNLWKTLSGTDHSMTKEMLSAATMKFVGRKVKNASLLITLHDGIMANL